MDSSHRKDSFLGSSSAKPIILDDDDEDDALDSAGRQVSKKPARRKKARTPKDATGSGLKDHEVESGQRSIIPRPQIGERRVPDYWQPPRQHQPSTPYQHQHNFGQFAPQQFVPVQQHWAYNTFNTDLGGAYPQPHSFAQQQNPLRPPQRPALFPAPPHPILPQNVSPYASPYTNHPVNAQNPPPILPPFAANRPAAYGGGPSAGPAFPPFKRERLIYPLDPWLRRPLKLTDFKTAGDLADAILLAAGIHPTLGSLNQDLRWLIDEFGPEVNEQSDFSTFRWDLGLERWREKRNSFTGVPQNGQASYTLPPQMMQQSRVIRPGDRSGMPVEGPGLARRPIDPTPRQPSQLRESSTPGSGAFRVAMNPPNQGQSGSITPIIRPPILPPQTKQNMAFEMKNGALQQTQNSLHRGSSTSRVSTPQRKNSFPQVEIPSPGSSTKKRGRPRKDPSGIPARTPVPRKRGRPFSTPDGAAKAAAKAEGRAVRPAGPKKRGRPFKTFEHTFIHQDPEYVPFLCEWAHCPAELINLETLEHHVMSVHAKNRHGLFCQWAKCKAPWDETNEAHESLHDHRTPFAIKAAMREHIKQEHLIPMAWHMGDGPKESSTYSPKSPLNQPWLNDSYGHQVTPSVKDQAVEPGYAKLNNRKRFVRRRDSNGEVYLEPVNSEVYGKVQEPTDDDDVAMEMAPSSTGLSVVLGPVKSPEIYQKVPDDADEEEEDDDEVDQVGMGSEMEMD